MSQTKRLAVAVLAAFAVAASPAFSQELKIGLASDPTSMDPHFHNLGPNNQLRNHIYESLVDQDGKQKLVPALAESWRVVDPTTWEFKLRKGVKFHDGSDFTAKDVIYTICRIPTVENSPSSFTVYTKAIVDVQAPDPHTLIIKTGSPHPLLATEISTWGVISASANGATGDIAFKRDNGCQGIGTPPKSEAFSQPATAVGTGPFKLVEHVRGDRIVLEANDAYWGNKSPWKKVLFRPITSEGPRVAALLAGDVDMIETPPVQDHARIKSSGATVASGLSNRIIYLHMDQFAEPTPGVKGTDKNPFKDKRVRQAISKAVNRKAIVDRIMAGVAVPAGDLLAGEFFGGDANRKPEEFDAAGAKALLKDAGYPEGFELVIGSPNDRYVNDEKISQAVAQMLSRIGIKATVDATTASQFFSRRNKFEYSMYLAGWGSGTGEMSSPLAALVATQDKAKGRGNTNAGRYSNPEMDKLLDEALATVDDEKREELLRKASKVVIDDYGIIPLHYEVTTWALRKGLAYEARADQYTLAYEVKEAK